MPSEITVIRNALDGKKSEQLRIYSYERGTIDGLPVVTAVTGVGVTNGAMTAALFCHHFEPQAVIVSGTGSRFRSSIRCGDTIISKKTIHHAAGSLTEDGMLYRKVRGPRPDMMTHFAYQPDRRLFRHAIEAVDTYRPETLTVDDETYEPSVSPGVVTASDMFGVSTAKIADMQTKLDPDLMEMESAAIAQVCDHWGFPHIVFRAGSNRTQSDPGTAYRKYGQTAAACAARWTVHYLRHLAASKR